MKNLSGTQRIMCCNFSIATDISFHFLFPLFFHHNSIFRSSLDVIFDSSIMFGFVYYINTSVFYLEIAFCAPLRLMFVSSVKTLFLASCWVSLGISWMKILELFEKFALQMLTWIWGCPCELAFFLDF